MGLIYLTHLLCHTFKNKNFLTDYLILKKERYFDIQDSRNCVVLGFDPVFV